MPHVITARDGRNHTIFDERDILSLVDEYAGFEIRRELEEWLEEQKALTAEAEQAAKEYEMENDQLRDHQRLVVSDMYEEASWLLKLTSDPHPKRSDIRECVQKIWDVLHREL